MLSVLKMHVYFIYEQLLHAFAEIVSFIQNRIEVRFSAEIRPHNSENNFLQKCISTYCAQSLCTAYIYLANVYRSLRKIERDMIYH